MDNKQAHDLIIESWKIADSWVVGKYTIMPDHIHLFCSPISRNHGLASWVKFWKSYCSGNWPNQNDKPIWQKSFWDTQLRKQDSYKQKWDYVKNNPTRKGLVTSSEDWAFQGELSIIEWHD